jgi:hypothetical protein
VLALLLRHIVPYPLEDQGRIGYIAGPVLGVFGLLKIQHFSTSECEWHGPMATWTKRHSKAAAGSSRQRWPMWSSSNITVKLSTRRHMEWITQGHRSRLHHWPPYLLLLFVVEVFTKHFICKLVHQYGQRMFIPWNNIIYTKLCYYEFKKDLHHSF